MAKFRWTRHRKILLYGQLGLWLSLGFSPIIRANEPLEHQSVLQPERPAADADLQRLKIGDRLLEAGDIMGAKDYYQQAKPPFTEAIAQELLAPITDPAELSPAGAVYWRNAQSGLEQDLAAKSLISLNLLTAEAPNFIPGRIAQLEQLQATEEIESATESLAIALANYGQSAELMTYAIEFYTETEQWLEASLAARQFALLNPDHPQQAEFVTVADETWEQYQSKLRARLRGNTIANLLTGTLGFVLTGSLIGPITALESTALLLQGEEAVGDRISRNIQDVAPMVEDEAVLDYIQTIGDRLTEFVGQDRFNYEYYVILDEDLNAFALPGGKIFINSGAILESRSESELAGLLGHEIAHAALSHGFQLVTQGNLTANIASNVPLGRIAGSLVVSKHSRNMERQADALGTRILAASPYAADGLYNLTVTLKENNPGNPPVWFSSHPGLDERIENIETQIVQRNYNRYTFEGVSRHQEIQAIVRELMAAEKRKEKEKEEAAESDD
ncbi:MAG: M48 family metallopeptidase [Limnothrix sp.]